MSGQLTLYGHKDDQGGSIDEMFGYDFLTHEQGTFGFGQLESIRSKIERAIELHCKVGVLMSVEEGDSHLPLSATGQKIVQSMLGSAFEALTRVPQPGEVHYGSVSQNQEPEKSIEVAPVTPDPDATETDSRVAVAVFPSEYPLMFTIEA